MVVTRTRIALGDTYNSNELSFVIYLLPGALELSCLQFVKIYFSYGSPGYACSQIFDAVGPWN